MENKHLFGDHITLPGKEQIDIIENCLGGCSSCSLRRTRKVHKIVGGRAQKVFIELGAGPSLLFETLRNLQFSQNQSGKLIMATASRFFFK